MNEILKTKKDQEIGKLKQIISDYKEWEETKAKPYRQALERECEELEEKVQKLEKEKEEALELVGYMYNSLNSKDQNLADEYKNMSAKLRKYKEQVGILNKKINTLQNKELVEWLDVPANRNLVDMANKYKAIKLLLEHNEPKVKRFRQIRDIIISIKEHGYTEQKLASLIDALQ